MKRIHTTSTDTASTTVAAANAESNRIEHVTIGLAVGTLPGTAPLESRDRS
ncbi:MAG: hypothetical protein ABEJ55_04250 [Halanaeroarchaeum sp.]